MKRIWAGLILLGLLSVTTPWPTQGPPDPVRLVLTATDSTVAVTIGDRAFDELGSYLHR